MLQIFDRDVIPHLPLRPAGTANPEFTRLDLRGRLPIFSAIQMDDLALARRYLSDAHTQANVTDDTGRTPLIFSIELGRVAITEALVLSGKFLDPEHVDDLGNTARNYATAYKEHRLLDGIPKPREASERSEARSGVNMKITG